jgi:hypothetical protein
MFRGGGPEFLRSHKKKGRILLQLLERRYKKFG